MARDVIEAHYRHLADNYDDFLVYSDEFVRTLSSKMVDKLKLQPGDRLVDLGGGTGIFAKDILKQVPLEQPVVLVDPFPEMLAYAHDHPGIECVEADALGFSEQPRRYDKVLMKEAVHHVEERARLFANLYERLSDGGILLLVHIPPKIDYPLFDKALERSLTWHADPDELCRLLAEAGFKVERDALDYRQVIPKEKYFSMVAGRYMSLLTSFEERELAEGLAEMNERYADREILEYNDHFDYLTAIKR